ncbi:hypothetical protein CQA24_26380 [Klebsiella pneumoniae]|nr:hypothetical protein [Klebsiella quasipneumoniae]MBE8798147.1 hypothetical protein [Klebsiella pneumoniae]RZB11362.1 hypothetical protein EVY01_04600 [Escherichia coli]PCP58030.1 hypothetical protein CQA35_25735 [Klebsiella pneumoniae]PCP58042.1 hypothetical protein CQA35_25800 [Klebsiella pneumoniae]
MLNSCLNIQRKVDAKIVSWMPHNPVIYHNIRCPHPLRASEGISDGKPIKQTTNHPQHPRKRAG